MLLDRTQLDGITRQAREVHPVVTVLTWVAAVLFSVGWLSCKTVGVLWLAGAWVFVATREGWRKAKAGHGPGRPG